MWPCRWALVSWTEEDQGEKVEVAAVSADHAQTSISAQTLTLSASESRCVRKVSTQLFSCCELGLHHIRRTSHNCSKHCKDDMTLDNWTNTEACSVVVFIFRVQSKKQQLKHLYSNMKDLYFKKVLFAVVQHGTRGQWFIVVSQVHLVYQTDSAHCIYDLHILRCRAHLLCDGT